MPRLATGIAGGLLVVAGAGIGWSLHRFLPQGGAPAATEEEGASVTTGEMRVPVRVVPAERGDFPHTVPAAGVVRAEPQGELGVTSRAGGRILAVATAPGARVAAGDVLASIDASAARTALGDARARAVAADGALTTFDETGRSARTAELQAAEAATKSQDELARAALERTRGLHADGLASDRALAEATKAAADARRDADLASRARAAYEEGGADRERATLLAARDSAATAQAEAEAILAEAEVQAPAAGRVVAVSVRPGDLIDPGAPIARLAVSGDRAVVFGLRADAARELHAGSRATWTDAAGSEHSGTVRRIGAAVASELGLVEVVVLPDPPDTAGPIGESVRGELEVGLFHDAVLVPAQAVVRSEDRRVVVVAGPDDRARIVPVHLLAAHAGRAAVEGKLEAGDRVVVEGGYNVPDGARLVVQTDDGGSGDGSGGPH